MTDEFGAIFLTECRFSSNFVERNSTSPCRFLVMTRGQSSLKYYICFPGGTPRLLRHELLTCIFASMSF